MRKVYTVIIIIISLLLAVLHAFSNLLPWDIQIDGTVIFLLVIAALVPYMPQIVQRITQIEFPGGGKIVLEKEIRKAEEKTTEAVLAESSPEAKRRLEEKVANTKAEPLKVRDSLPIALTGTEMDIFALRMNIERTLSEIVREYFWTDKREVRRGGIPACARELLAHEVISPAFHEAILSFSRIANRVIHGEKVRLEQVEKIRNIGIDILDTLSDTLRTLQIMHQQILAKYSTEIDKSIEST